MPEFDDAIRNALIGIDLLDRSGKLSSQANPQMLEAVKHSRSGPNNALDIERALSFFNGQSAEDGQRVSQSVPGVMLRETLSIL